MSTHTPNIHQAAQALMSAVVDRQFESLPRLSLAYREATIEAAQGQDYWKLGHESVSLESMTDIIGKTEYIETSTRAELALVIESFPVNLSLAFRLVQNDACPRDLLIDKLLLSEPKLDLTNKLRTFMHEMANKDANSADKLLCHVLSTQGPDSGQLQFRDNLDYIFATLQAIETPSKRLASEFESLDHVLASALLGLVDKGTQDPMAYETLAILYSCGCKALCRVAMVADVLHFYRDNLIDNSLGWKAVADAKVPLPTSFVAFQCNKAGTALSTSSEGERMGFVFYQYLAGRRMPFESCLPITTSIKQAKEIFTGLSYAYAAAQRHGMDTEDRLIPLLSYLEQSIKNKELFVTLALESSIPGKTFSFLPSMKKHHGSLFTKDLGV